MLPTPAHPPRLHIEDPSFASPSIMSADQSHTPSEVSPITPISDITRRSLIQQQPAMSPLSAVASPYQLFPHPLEQLPLESHPQYHPRCDYSMLRSQLTVAPSPTVAPVHLVSPSGGGPSKAHQHSPMPLALLPPPVHDVLTYQPVNGETFESEPPAICREIPSRIVGDRAYCLDNELWWPQPPLQNLGVIDHEMVHQSTRTYNSRTPPYGGQHLAESFREHIPQHQHGNDNLHDAEQPATAGQAIHYPQEVCNICGVHFTGQYVGFPHWIWL
jgi:hypothetical protein